MPLFIVVEKILGPDEPLPPEWPVAGTTGYDFLNLVNGLLVDRAGLAEIAKVYQRFIGERTDFREVPTNRGFCLAAWPCRAICNCWRIGSTAFRSAIGARATSR